MQLHPYSTPASHSSLCLALECSLEHMQVNCGAIVPEVNRQDITTFQEGKQKTSDSCFSRRNKGTNSRIENVTVLLKLLTVLIQWWSFNMYRYFKILTPLKLRRSGVGEKLLGMLPIRNDIIIQMIISHHFKAFRVKNLSSSGYETNSNWILNNFG